LPKNAQRSSVCLVRDICAVLDAWAPPEWAYSWDRAGLSTGTPEQPVEKVLVCLSVNRSAFEAAVKIGAQMIVSHHPLIWNPLKSLRSDDIHTRLCLDIAAANLACYSAHTNLDVAPGGTSWILADSLGLQNCRVLFPAAQARQLKLIVFVPESHLDELRDAVAEAGAGIIGDYSHCTFSAPGVGTFRPGDNAHPYSGRVGELSEEPERRFEVIVPAPRIGAVIRAVHAAHPYEETAYDVYPLENCDPRIGLGVRGELARARRLDEFATFVREQLKSGHVRVVGKPKQKITRVAVLGGSGGGEIAGLPDDVELYVTGDLKYHDAEAAQARGISVIDAGHAGTELPVVSAVARRLRGALPHLKVQTFLEPPLFQVVS